MIPVIPANDPQGLEQETDMQQQTWMGNTAGRSGQGTSLPGSTGPRKHRPGKGAGSSGRRTSRATAWILGLAVLALTGPVTMQVRAQANAPAAAPANKTPAADDTRITPLLVRPFDDIPGKEGMVQTVEYAPGASTEAHRHEAHTFVYVLEGAIVMQVQGGEAVTLKAGQTFYESPTDVHTVSRNASATEPAKFLVFFVKNKDRAPVLPVK